MSTFLEWLSIGFVAALYAAASTLPLALLALAIDAMAGRFLAARFRCLLWIVVAVRLVMPMAPESTWSLQQAWQLTAVDESPKSTRPISLLRPPRWKWRRRLIGDGNGWA